MGACLGSSKKQKDSDTSPTFRTSRIEMAEEKPYKPQVNAEIQSRQTAPIEQNQYKIGQSSLFTLLYYHAMSISFLYFFTDLF